MITLRCTLHVTFHFNSRVLIWQISMGKAYSVAASCGKYIVRSVHVAPEWQWHWSVRFSTPARVSLIVTSHFWIPSQKGLQFRLAMCAAEDWVRTSIPFSLLCAKHWSLGIPMFFIIKFTSSTTKEDVLPRRIVGWKQKYSQLYENIRIIMWVFSLETNLQ